MVWFLLFFGDAVSSSAESCAAASITARPATSGSAVRCPADATPFLGSVVCAPAGVARQCSAVVKARRPYYSGCVKLKRGSMVLLDLKRKHLQGIIIRDSEGLFLGLVGSDFGVELQRYIFLERNKSLLNGLIFAAAEAGFPQVAKESIY